MSGSGASLSDRDRAIAAYRAAHGLQATCDRFGLKLRRVQQICQAAKSAGLFVDQPGGSAGAARPASTVAAHIATSVDVGLPSLDAVAGEDTTWICPHSGEPFPIVPGTVYASWLRDRERVRRLASLRLVVERDKPRKVLQVAGASEDATGGDRLPLGGGLGGALQDVSLLHVGSAGGSARVFSVSASSVASARNVRKVVKCSDPWPGLLPLLGAALGRSIAAYPLPWLAAVAGLVLCAWAF